MTLDLRQCDDKTLANLATGGHEQAIREIMRRHQDAVFRLIRSNTRDPEEALDILQECFVSAFSAIHRYDADRPFKFWISRIALNKCRDWARRRAVRSFFWKARQVDPEVQLVSDLPDPGREAEGRNELAHVRNAISALPRKLREVITLRAIEELSQAETAEILNISEKAVETRLYRARSHLRRAIGGAMAEDDK